MKSNLISAIAGWKSAALLALVAMVAAVAFSGVLTSDAQASPSVAVSDITWDQDGSNVSFTTTITNGPELSEAQVTANEGNGDAADDVVGAWSFIVTRSAATDAETAPVSVGACTSDDALTDTDSALAATSGALGATYTVTAYSGTTCATDGDELASTTFQLAAATELSREANAGDTVEVTFAVDEDGASPARVELSLSDDGATGTFSANGKDSLTCTDNNNCDQSDHVRGLVTIAIDVSEDSPVGTNLYLDLPDGTTPTGTVAIEVVKPTPKPASFTVAPMEGEETAAAGTGTSTIVVTVMDDTTPVAKPYSGPIAITFITPNGKVACVEGEDPENTCSESSTNATGQADATLSGGEAGSATITVLVGKLGAGSTEVTFFGAADSLAVDVPQSSINLGGGAFVTFTVTDADDRPVKGADITQPAVDAVVAPDVDDAVKVSVARVDNEDDDADDAPKGEQYCDDGTNAAGQCVVRVSSAAAPPTAATRGDHTLNFQLVVDPADPTKTLTAEVVITVAGPPDSIGHDAPGRIDTLDEIEVSLTVTDDAGNPVGSQPVSITKVEGGGAILDQDDNTTNGEATFTYLASSLEGNVVLVVRSGDARAVINVAVGPEPEPVVEEEPEPEPVPPPPPPVWGQDPLPSGTWNLVWNGEDGADPSAGALEGVTAIWRWTGTGWQGYFPEASDVPGGNNLESLTNGAAYWVIVE